jgi:hypothetical protein
MGNGGHLLSEVWNSWRRKKPSAKRVFSKKSCKKVKISSQQLKEAFPLQQWGMEVSHHGE